MVAKFIAPLLACAAFAVPAAAQSVTGLAQYPAGTGAAVVAGGAVMVPMKNGALRGGQPVMVPPSVTDPLATQPMPSSATGAYTSATIGTTAGTVGATPSVFLDVVNLSSSATVCLGFGAAPTVSGTTCAAGEIALPPLWHRSWEGSFVPADQLYAIASSAATPISIGVK